MISNRVYTDRQRDQTSLKRKLNHKNWQGSILAPIIFNWYIGDIPRSSFRKFMYTDEWPNIITFNDVNKYWNLTLLFWIITLKIWRLQPNPIKSVTSNFHLNNRMVGSPVTVSKVITVREGYFTQMITVLSQRTRADEVRACIKSSCLRPKVQDWFSWDNMGIKWSNK